MGKRKIDIPKPKMPLFPDQKITRADFYWFLTAGMLSDSLQTT
ncbi:hypothetical protein AM1_1846 [Acaryochloris marina MBIC11017]|uniref:Uncharacterized protein n=1 Tax=Acaryochloris marina (strain MBIC 11017) TaxID=329726 RepID=B0CDE1_ACAM1|nr:hypothetical protein AM1_1846 [Acaryochloris marina MBIC11017]